MWLLTDEYLFPLQHVLLISLAFFCAYQDFMERRRLGIVAGVKRGAESLKLFWDTLAYASIVVTLVNQCATQRDENWYMPYTVLANALDIFVLCYLCLWSRYSRNAIIRIKNYIQMREENP